MTTPEDVQQLIADEGVQIIDVKFTDLLGAWQHFSVTPSEWDTDTFEEGLGFDGSSIRGFQGIQRSDMILIPDPDTAVLDPFARPPALRGPPVSPTSPPPPPPPRRPPPPPPATPPSASRPTSRIP